MACREGAEEPITLDSDSPDIIKRPARTLGSAKRKRIEAANNTVKKIPRIMGDEDAFFKRMTDYMDSKFGGVTERLDDNSARLEDVSKNVAKNAEDISNMKTQIDDLKSGKALEDKVEEMVKRSIEKQAPLPDKMDKEMKRVGNEVDKLKALQGVRQHDRRDSSQEERHYWWSRRAVRIWPVVGTTNQELWRATGEFFFRVLEIPESNLTEDSVESVRKIFPVRSRGKPKSRVGDEVRVLFKDIETRDMIHSYAPNLADKRGEAGMRLEVPSHLLGQFKSLERYGRHLKGIHGQQMRWHIKYDDSELNMFLNVKLSEDDKWNKVDFTTAREEIRSQEASSASSFRERLSSSSSVSSFASATTDKPEEDMETNQVDRSGLPQSRTLEKFKGKNTPPRWGQKK